MCPTKMQMSEFPMYQYSLLIIKLLSWKYMLHVNVRFALINIDSLFYLIFSQLLVVHFKRFFVFSCSIYANLTHLAIDLYYYIDLYEQSCILYPPKRAFKYISLSDFKSRVLQ